MTDRTANPCTPVRFRARPPSHPTENLGQTGERIALRAAHEANEERTATGADPGTARPLGMIQASGAQGRVNEIRNGEKQ